MPRAQPLSAAGPGIAILLPQAEHFGPAQAGAVALHVRDAVRASRFRDAIRVYGQGVRVPFTGIDFEPLLPAFGGLLGRNLGLAEQLVRRLCARPPALVELHNRPQVFHYLAWRAPRLPLAIRFANDPQTMRHARSPRARARILRRARAIYCVSDYVKRRFLDGVATDSDKLRVVITGIGRWFAAPPEKSPLIAYAGRITAAKGVADLIQALARVLPGHPAWRAEIIGTSATRRRPAMSALERRLRAESAALGDRIAWPGRLTNDQVLERFGRAAVVVIPSRWPEPLARTAIEALAAGAAVIAYGSGGLPEVLAGRGLIVEVPGPAGLAAALDRVLGDDDRRRQLQRQAWDDFPFTVAAMAGRLDEVRAEALGARVP